MFAFNRCECLTGDRLIAGCQNIHFLTQKDFHFVLVPSSPLYWPGTEPFTDETSKMTADPVDKITKPAIHILFLICMPFQSTTIKNDNFPYYKRYLVNFALNSPHDDCIVRRRVSKYKVTYMYL